MNSRRLKILTLLAVLSALLTVGRIMFAYIPNVKPNTSMLIISSYVLGPVNGFILAAISTIASNMYLGSGIWTIGQITAWGTIALFSGWLGKRKKRLPFWSLALLAGASGYYFGMVMTLFYAPAVDHVWAYYLAGLTFDTNHAIGNLVFFAIIAKPLHFILEREMKKFKKNSL